MIGSASRSFRRLAPLLLAAGLAACGGRARLSNGGYANGAGYAAPGPATDPWQPYVHEAASRFDVPEAWVREVMRQESGGHEYLNGRPITSDAGAMGLMQIMPATYDMLRDRYSLGGDPYDPHDNILAGTAYIRELFDKYGSPAFLAAYNAGPQRLENYLNGSGSLPNETVTYLASVAPRLGDERPLSGPLAAYAGGGGAVEVASAPEPAEPAPPPSWPAPREAAAPSPPGCWHDPDAAYDPQAPCQTPPAAAPPPVQLAEATPPPYQAPLPPPAPMPAATVPGSLIWGGAPRPAAPVQPAAPAAPPPRFRFALVSSASAAEARPLPAATGGWGIQVGAFITPDVARQAAETARGTVPGLLGAAHVAIGHTAPFGGQVLYRARLVGLTASGASGACSLLTAQRQACLTVPPGA